MGVADEEIHPKSSSSDKRKRLEGSLTNDLSVGPNAYGQTDLKVIDNKTVDAPSSPQSHRPLNHRWPDVVESAIFPAQQQQQQQQQPRPLAVFSPTKSEVTTKGKDETIGSSSSSPRRSEGEAKTTPTNPPDVFDENMGNYLSASQVSRHFIVVARKLFIFASFSFSSSFCFHAFHLLFVFTILLKKNAIDVIKLIFFALIVS